MRVRKNMVIRIELKSDLCAGSGYSHAGVIDSDVCYDDCGIPYIPAKRLRGCFRETLESCLYARQESYGISSEKFFGEAGSESESEFVIGNGRIPQYEELRGQILERRNGKTGEYYGTQQIMERFARVIGQTEIDEFGAAKDNSLRYTRVVNRFTPLEPEKDVPLVFEAPVLLSAEDDETLRKKKAMLEEIVVCTRHIGLKRNRGFGNVRCSLKDDQKENAGSSQQEEVAPEQNRKITGDDPKDDYKTEAVKRIRIRLHNEDPLVMSGRSENTSELYISGQSLLGALAGGYLKDKGKECADSSEFQDLFVNGSTLFSNLYPCVAGHVFYPAPAYINRLKKTEKLVSVLQTKLPDKETITVPEFQYGDGNQPKKLKGKFVFREGPKVAVHEVKQEVIYHHSHRNLNAQNKEGLLYDLEVISPHQDFEGFIDVPGKYEDCVLNLIRRGDLWFGKSKSSQYGRCKVDVISSKEKPARENMRITCENGKKDRELVVTFLSDAIFLSGRGEYTVCCDEIKDIVRKSLISETTGNEEETSPKCEDDSSKTETENAEKFMSNLQTTTATGYVGVWKLRKDAVPAIAAGSCLVFRVPEGSILLKKEFVGVRNQEGYGQIRLDYADAMRYDGLSEVSYEQTKKRLPENSSSDESGSEGRKFKELRTLMGDFLFDCWIDAAVYQYLGGGAKRADISNSALGRITMMLRESLENHSDPKLGKDAKAAREALDDFAERIGSIKSPSVKEEGVKVLKLVAQNVEFEGSKAKTITICLAQKKGKSPQQESIEQELKNLGFEQGEVLEKINGRWGDFLMKVLSVQKYLGGDR